MQGVVSLPHGWGHDAAGARMDTARAANDVRLMLQLTEEVSALLASPKEAMPAMPGSRVGGNILRLPPLPPLPPIPPIPPLRPVGRRRSRGDYRISARRPERLKFGWHIADDDDDF